MFGIKYYHFLIAIFCLICLGKFFFISTLVVYNDIIYLYVPIRLYIIIYIYYNYNNIYIYNIYYNFVCIIMKLFKMH
jgi:hypothetical protein